MGGTTSRLHDSLGGERAPTRHVARPLAPRAIFFRSSGNVTLTLKTRFAPRSAAVPPPPAPSMPRLSDASAVGSAGPTPRASANLSGGGVTAPAQIPSAHGRSSLDSVGGSSTQSEQSEFSKSWERQRDLTRDRLQERLY